MPRSLEAVAERDGKWWVFEIPELGAGGQARDLAELEHEARGVAAMWLNTDPSEIAITVTVRGQDAVLAEWSAAERDEDSARNAQALAAERRRAVIRQLRAAGWSAPDTGRVLGISKQRVYQLERTATKTN